ncbi:MAG: alpha-L-fucosidase [bacterium]|nr:alpha-L-fucosidase [bacterium]
MSAIILLSSAMTSVAAADAAPPAPVPPLPSPRQLAWQDLEYYGFVHFNMNTFTDVEWGEGEETPGLFNPTELDCRQWARVCRDAGMRGIVITAKHHDGFCLWPSAYTEHTVKNSPWRHGQGDLLQELASACREFGLKFGVYMSPWDRHEPSYGDSARYNEHFRNQLRETLTNYGEVFEVWFDGACGEGPNGKRQVYDWPGFIGVVRECQPNAVIFSDAGPDIRWVGNEQGFANPTNWSLLDRDEFHPGSPRYKELTSGHRDGTHWLPAEIDVSIRPGWYYHPEQDDQVKPLEHVVDIYFHAVGRNGSLLLNLPVDRRGLVHENDAARLMELRQYLDATFTEDFAQGATATATNARAEGHPAFAPGNVVDGNAETYWATDDSEIEATLELKLSARATFSVFMAEEFIALGQRVESFEVEALIGEEWEQIAKGTTIGNKRLLRFPAVTTDRIRMRVHEAKGCPAIATVGLFLAPPKVAVEPDTGDFIGSQEVRLSTDVPGATIRYTLDGSDPGEDAQVYTGPFTISETTTVKARAFFEERYTVAPVVAAFTGYNESGLVAAMEPDAAIESGLTYTYYEGGWQSLHDFDKAQPVATGKTNGFDLNVRKRDEHFAVRFEGYVQIARPGLYTFSTKSDDGSRLFIGERMVVDNDGLHGMVEQRGRVPLASGLHPISVMYFNAKGDSGLEVMCAGPDGAMGPVSADRLFRTP